MKLGALAQAPASNSALAVAGYSLMIQLLQCLSSIDQSAVTINGKQCKNNFTTTL